MQNASVAASPALSARLASEQNPDESVLEWTLGRISLPPSSPQMTSFSEVGEEMQLADLESSFAREPAALLDATQPNNDSAKKLDDDAELERLEALKAHIPACLSNVLNIAPAAVTGKPKWPCFADAFFGGMLVFPVLQSHAPSHRFPSAHERAVSAKLQSYRHPALLIKVSRAFQA